LLSILLVRQNHQARIVRPAAWLSLVVMQGVQDTAEHGNALLGVARIAQLPRLADITLRVSDPGSNGGGHLDLHSSQELIALALSRHLRRAHLSRRRIVCVEGNHKWESASGA
jgi:hypothetical protein